MEGQGEVLKAVLLYRRVIRFHIVVERFFVAEIPVVFEMVVKFELNRVCLLDNLHFFHFLRAFFNVFEYKIDDFPISFNLLHNGLVVFGVEYLFKVVEIRKFLGDFTRFHAWTLGLLLFFPLLRVFTLQRMNWRAASLNFRQFLFRIERLGPKGRVLSLPA